MESQEPSILLGTNIQTSTKAKNILCYYSIINQYWKYGVPAPWVATTVAWPVPAPVARGPHGPPNHCY